MDDALVKAAFSRPENAIGALRAVLPPALLARLDLTTLKLSARDTYIDDATLGQLFSDLVYEVQLAGRPALVCFVLYEHQSTEDPLLIVRISSYVAGVWRGWLADNPGARRVPAVIPVVLYHGPKPWSAPTSLVEVIDLEPDDLAAVGEHVPSFSFVLDDLSAVDESDLRSRDVAVLGRVAFLLLKFARSVGPPGRPGALTLEQLFDKTVSLLTRLVRPDLTLSIRYIIEVSGAEPEDVAVALKDAPIEVRETAMTLAEKLRQQGRLEGRRDTLLGLLRLKFGTITPDVEVRIRAADEAALEAWTAAILTANSVVDVFEAPSS